jgi:hypothetical protein
MLPLGPHPSNAFAFTLELPPFWLATLPCLYLDSRASSLLGPQPCNPFALVASPKLGLRQSQYYEAFIMFKASTSSNYANHIITFFFKGLNNALTAPILPFCNYYGNPAHKANECNIPFEDLFCDYCEK